MQSQFDKKSQLPFIENINKIRLLLDKPLLTENGVCFGLNLLLLKYSREDNIEEFTNITNITLNLKNEIIDRIIETYTSNKNIFFEYNNFQYSLKKIIDFSDIIYEIQCAQNYKSMMLNWISSKFVREADLKYSLFEKIEKDKFFSLFIHNNRHIFSLERKDNSLLYYEPNINCTTPQCFQINEKEQIIEAIRKNEMIRTILSGGYYYLDEISYGYENSIIDEIANSISSDMISTILKRYNSGEIAKNTLLFYIINEMLSILPDEFNLADNAEQITDSIIQLIDNKCKIELMEKYPHLYEELNNLVKNAIDELEIIVSDIEDKILEKIESAKWDPPRMNDAVTGFITFILSPIVSINNGALFNRIVESLLQNEVIKPFLERSLNDRSNDSLFLTCVTAGSLDILNYLNPSASDMIINYVYITPIYIAGIKTRTDIIKKYINELEYDQPNFFHDTWNYERDKIIRFLLKKKNYHSIERLISAGIVLKNEEILLLPEHLSKPYFSQLSYNGYDLYLVSKKELNKSAGNLKNSPYLLMNENKYSLRGYKKNGWEWTELGEDFKIPNEWINKKEIFISYNDEIYHSFRKHHSHDDFFLFNLHEGIFENSAFVAEQIRKNSIYKIEIHGNIKSDKKWEIIKKIIIQSEVKECIIPGLQIKWKEELELLLTNKSKAASKAESKIEIKHNF